MRSLVIAVAILLSAPMACPAADEPSAPDFSWGANCSGAVRTSLDQARLKWQRASEVPTSPDLLKSARHKTLTEAYLREVMPREGISYSLLDAATAKLKSVDECRIGYLKAVALAGRRAPRNRKPFDDACYHLKSTIRLAIGVARAQIACEMSGRPDNSYCFQAMEAAIDALRDAAADAACVTGGAARAARIRAFRAALFEAWEASERTKDTGPIGSIDLVKAWDGAGLCRQERN